MKKFCLHFLKIVLIMTLIIFIGCQMNSGDSKTSGGDVTESNKQPSRKDLSVNKLILDEFNGYFGKSLLDIYPNLKNVIIPDGVSSIKESAFSNVALETITIPISINSIGRKAFQGCSAQLIYEGYPQMWNSITKAEGWNDDCGQLKYLQTNPEHKSVTVPISNSGNLNIIDTSRVVISGSGAIQDKAFNGCSGIIEVIIEDGIISIGSNAFEGCSNLTGISISGSVRIIGNNVFKGCTNLKYIKVSSNNQYYAIKNDALYNRTYTQLICYPSGRTGSLTIPTSVISISNNAFSGCKNLTRINFEGTEEQWNKIYKEEGWNKDCPSNMVINFNYKTK